MSGEIEVEDFRGMDRNAFCLASEKACFGSIIGMIGCMKYC